MSRPAHRPRVTVSLHGEFDLSRRDEIAGRITGALDIAGVEEIAIDLADVTFLDCYSLGELLHAHHRGARHGVTVFVVHPDNPLVRRILDTAPPRCSALRPPSPAADVRSVRAGWRSCGR